MDTENDEVTPHQEAINLKKFIFACDPDACDENELAKATQRLSIVYEKLVEEVSSNYLIDRCNYLNDFINSGHRTVNEKGDFLKGINEIISEQLELSSATEDKFILTTIKYECFTHTIRKIAKNLVAQGEVIRAIKWYEALFKIEESGDSIWMDYIKLIKTIGNHNDICDAFERAVKSLSDPAWICNNYGHYLYQQERYADAEIKFSDAILQQEKNKFNYSEYYDYATSMLDKTYIKSDQLVKRLFNYDARLTVNLTSKETLGQIAKIVEQLKS